MALATRRNPSRSRQKPMRFADQQFVSGRYDQYTRGYDGWQDKNSLSSKRQDAENYYVNYRGQKLYGNRFSYTGYQNLSRDFPESLLELSSIWRDLKLVIPEDTLHHISTFLNIKNIDRQLITQDDTFIVADDSEEYAELSDSDHVEFESGSDTDEDVDYDSEELYDSD